MGIFRFRRKPAARPARKGRTGPLLPEAGLSGSARRVNGVVGAMALFGAFGAVALAVALTPGGQPSATSASASQASASQAALAVGEVEAQPVAIEARPVATETVSLPAPVAPEPPRTVVAAKSDRLTPSYQAPGRIDRSPDPRRLRGSVPEEASEYEIAPIAERLQAPALEALSDGGLQAEIETDSADPPVPGEAVDGTSANVGGEAGEDASADSAKKATDEADAAAVDAAVEEMVGEVVEEAPEEPAVATQSASVRTDVNMRAGPSNSAAVILVVPGSSDVEVIGCDYWCEVTYRGQRGWIYKSFVRRAES